MVRPSSSHLQVIIAMGLLLVVCGLPSSVESTTMPYATLPDLVEKSDLIVRGTVTGQRTFVDSETDRITTRTTVDDEVTYYGKLDRDSFEVEQWGGTVDGRTLEIPGNAQFREGDDVVLFLEHNDGEGDFPAYLVAMAQAKFDIVFEQGEESIWRTPSGIAYVAPEEASGQLEEPMSLESFEARLESLIYSLK